jgi:hypothetical protein
MGMSIATTSTLTVDRYGGDELVDIGGGVRGDVSIADSDADPAGLERWSAA